MSSGFLISDRVVGQVRGILDSLMDYTCTVKRGTTPGPVGGYNQPAKPTVWTEHLLDQECGYKTSTETINTGEQQDEDRSIVISRKEMKFPYGTDIDLNDRVYDLRDREGNLAEPEAQYFDIKELLHSNYKLKVVVEAIY